MASDAYWNATKPNGMPDSVWQAQQAAKKAAEEAAKKAAEEAAKKAAEQLLASVQGSGIVPTTQDKINNFGASSINSNIVAQEAAAKKAAEEAAKKANSSKVDGTSTNDARAEQMAIKNNTTPDYSKDYTGYVDSAPLGNVGLSTEDARDEKLAIKNNTTPDYIKEEQSKNLSTNSARQEHTAVMNNSSMNPMTDGEITLGYLTGGNNSDTNKTGNNGNSVNNSPTVGSTNTDTVNPTGGSSSNVSSPSVSGSSGGSYSGDTYNGGVTYKAYPTAEEMANYVSTIIQAAKGELGDVVKPEYMKAEKPGEVELRSLEELAETYGITYDYDKLYGLFNDSVEAQYKAIYDKQKQNENAYYDNATAAQNTLLDTLSRDRGNAVQAGVSKGMQAANALGAMLGVSQQFADNATALSQERTNTANNYGAAIAKAKVDAEATSNERKNAIMEIAKMLYGYDSEQYVANMDNYNTVLTNNAALQQTYMNNNAALQNALASIFGGVANNKISGDANVQSSTLASEAQKAAAQYAAAAQQYAAQQSYLSNQAIADANKYSADLSYQLGSTEYQNKQNTLTNNEVKQTGTTSSTTNNGTVSTNVSNSGLTNTYETIKNYINSTIPAQAMNATNKAANDGLEVILKALGITK